VDRVHWGVLRLIDRILCAVHYSEFDVLLHPALAEPYGMVTSEAMAARVPVVISDRCGAESHVAANAGGSIVIGCVCSAVGYSGRRAVESH